MLDSLTVAGNNTDGFFAAGGNVLGKSVMLIDSTFFGNAADGCASSDGVVESEMVSLGNATISGKPRRLRFRAL